MSTKERLAQVLHAHGLFDLEARARTGEFDDYESPHAFPLMRLVAELSKLEKGGRFGPGFYTLGETTAVAAVSRLIERVKDGEFDGTKEEADAWARSPEGQETFRMLLRRRDEK